MEEYALSPVLVEFKNTMMILPINRAYIQRGGHYGIVGVSMRIVKLVKLKSKSEI